MSIDARSASPPRERLIEAAVRLFYRDGYHATGVDAILAEAGVAKMSLYKHFKSKDELILAALRRRDERFRETARQQIQTRWDSPRERVLALFVILEEWFEQPDFSGCMFINAAAEYAPPDDPIHTAAAEHKRVFEDYVRELTAAASAANPTVLAKQLMLLWEGAITTAHVSGPDGVARQAREIAEVLLAREVVNAGDQTKDG